MNISPQITTRSKYRTNNITTNPTTGVWQKNQCVHKLIISLFFHDRNFKAQLLEEMVNRNTDLATDNGNRREGIPEGRKSFIVAPIIAEGCASHLYPVHQSNQTLHCSHRYVNSKLFLFRIITILDQNSKFIMNIKHKKSSKIGGKEKKKKRNLETKREDCKWRAVWTRKRAVQVGLVFFQSSFLEIK